MMYNLNEILIRRQGLQPLPGIGVPNPVGGYQPRQRFVFQ